LPRVGKRSLSSVSMRCFCEDEGECYLFLNVAVFFFNIKAKKVSTSFSLLSFQRPPLIYCSRVRERASRKGELLRGKKR
jgi:hypothetical protein